MRIKHIVLIITFIILYLLIQPFLFLFIAKHHPQELNKYYRYSAETSIFKFQKKISYKSIIHIAIIEKKYDVALEYIDKSKKQQIGDSKTDLLLEHNLYLELKDYDKALKVAKQLNYKIIEIETYIAMKDTKKAHDTLVEYQKKLGHAAGNNLCFYEAQIEYMEESYIQADIAINKYLSEFDTSIKAWELKSEIALKLNNQKDYEYSMKKVNELEKEIKKQVQDIVD